MGPQARFCLEAAGTGYAFPRKLLKGFKGKERSSVDINRFSSVFHCSVAQHQTGPTVPSLSPGHAREF